jgi:methylmalonyl-CoA mutase N-terminal domain/subunit
MKPPALPRSTPSPRCAAGGEGNLLELAVAAAKARATLGEISDAMEKPSAAQGRDPLDQRGLRPRIRHR